ncbi:unnamed protein product [Blepharisma stoltei]|uniref:Tubulin--tyrosine ligase-like protein 5 n=1 Tax=Blepharisma stoltei TaxID=1481888 RepID=A0AAU9J428_9CILI|nr:unnamed protein product [Blepharisma stoltei]
MSINVPFQFDLMVFPKMHQNLLNLYSKPPENKENDSSSSEAQQILHLPTINGKYLLFTPFTGPRKRFTATTPGYYYKCMGDVSLIRRTCEENGLREHKSEWRILWGNKNMRSNVYTGLARWQKINHFPRSFEITKKDCLFKNIAKMQALHGIDQFGFIPETYVLPNETYALEQQMLEDPGVMWIIKPSAKSQGKGIYLTNKPAELPSGQSYVACRYIDNPLLINELKFDLRIYVAVTSLDPLRIYIYKEGLVRFATEKYRRGQIDNRFVHLTNYSVNKFSPNFVSVDQDGQGHKWTLTALREYFKSHNQDFSLIWSKIKDIVVKTIISNESKNYASMKMFVPYRQNCFELLGFDILIDDSYTPWLLEVNLSPSLNTDSPLDLRIKGKLIADLFNLVGIPAKQKNAKKSKPVRKPAWNSSTISANTQFELSQEEIYVLKETNNELQRLGDFERIFPSELSFVYMPYFEEERTMNLLVCGELDKAKRQPTRSAEKAFLGNVYRQRLKPLTRERKNKPNSAAYLNQAERYLRQQVFRPSMLNPI